jgi:uncharacterized phage protein gp47/JayE
VTFEEIMERMMAMVPDDIDKREDKSLIWHTLSPVAAMMAEAWIYGDNIHNSSIPDNEMCAGSVLTRKCAEHGVNRQLASRSVRLGIFADSGGSPADVDIGDTFVAESIVYTAIYRKEAGQYALECAQAGIIGNQYFGPVLPLETARQLGAATLGDVLTPGENEETDEALRLRFYVEVNALPYGGNIDQYLKWVKDIPGVGDAKIFPVPKDQGGRVHIVIAGPDNSAVSSDFISQLKEMIDPEPHANGKGVAPIGHWVTISTVTEKRIDVSSSVLLKSGYSLAAARSEVEEVLKAYFSGFSFEEATVRVSRVESGILSANGVADYFSTALNGQDANIQLNKSYNIFEVPVLGALTLTEV